MMHGCLNLLKSVFRVVAHDSLILSVCKMVTQFWSIEPHISNNTYPIIWRFSYDSTYAQSKIQSCTKKNGRGPLLVRALLLPCRQLPFWHVVMRTFLSACAQKERDKYFSLVCIRPLIPSDKDTTRMTSFKCPSKSTITKYNHIWVRASTYKFGKI